MHLAKRILIYSRTHGLILPNPLILCFSYLSQNDKILTAIISFKSFDKPEKLVQLTSALNLVRSNFNYYTMFKFDNELQIT